MSNPDWLEEVKDLEQFDYDATSSSGRRKTPRRVLSSEDYQLSGSKRGDIVSNIRNIRQNFTVARWAINKHIDFVTAHEFMPKTGDEGMDKLLASFVEYASEKKNFDISGRHDRRRWMRIAEASRLVDGDLFALRVRGGFLQAIESDRVKNPPLDNIDLNARTDWVNGIRVDNTNKPISYAVWSRTDNITMDFDRPVKSSAVIPYGFYDRFDQVRGVSPWASAINSLRDLYEAWDYALAKSKVAQLMALKITRDSEFGFNDDYDAELDTDGSGVDSNGNAVNEVSFDKGPQILDLDPGEDAAFISSSTPGGDTKEFWESLISVVLKSLNIPYSFYDEAHTNFFGSRAALILYLRSVEQWRQDVRSFLNDWLMWRLKVGVLKGELSLPSSFEINPKNWKWVAEGLQYWNPQQEVNADIAAIEAGLRTRSEIRTERFGDDWKSNVYEVLKVENELMSDIIKQDSSDITEEEDELTKEEDDTKDE